MGERITYPRVLAYHPEIAIRDNNGIVSIIKMDLPDFETNSTILRTLASTFSVSTAKELVEKIKSSLTTNKFAVGGSNNPPIIINSLTSSMDLPDHIQVIDWNEKIA